MMSRKIFPVVLCGGYGTRLWPLSRKGFPKQFLSFDDHNSLLQGTVTRLLAIGSENDVINPAILVANEEHRFIVKEQMHEIGQDDFKLILEPVGKNTAPAVTLAALSSLESEADPILVITPADHSISNDLAYISAINAAITEAEKGSLVILGIQPSQPETGYGYIRASRNSSENVDNVLEFVEKPDLDKAIQYVSSGDYFWNAGIFVFKSRVWLEAIQSLAPEISKWVDSSWIDRKEDGFFVRPNEFSFLNVKSDSVDYAVLESCQDLGYALKMVKLDAGWNDLGAWDAVWGVKVKDESGNVFRGDVLAESSKNNLVFASNRLVGLVGIENLIVVETADAVLVANRTHSQNVKEIVCKLAEGNRTEHELHRKVLRPWGWYDSVDSGDRFQVKRIGVKPGGSLSLQTHNHRAEHWIVVCGIAEVTKGSEVFLLQENQSTYIPKGEVHRLRNVGDNELEIIEVQSGDYLGEDDIVRIEDRYGRK